MKNLKKTPKIVLPYKANRLKSSIDFQGEYCSYDVTIFIPDQTQNLNINVICGILNSRAIQWYFETYGKKMGPILEFYSTPFSKIRIPLIIEPFARKIKKLVKAIIKLKKNHLESTNDDEKIANMQTEIDALVFDSFRLTEKEVDMVLESLKVNLTEKKNILKLLNTE